MSENAEAAIALLQMSQESQQKSVSSQDRKDRILDGLFTNRRETVVKLNLFRGLLSVFFGFVKSFQSEKPMIHTLHRQMVAVTTELLGMFIKPEYIPDSVSQLQKLDITDKLIQKADRELSVGKYAYSDLNKARLDKTCQHWVSDLYHHLRSGYVKAAEKILQMPINNKTIRWLSVLDPELAGHSQAASSLKKIAGLLPNLLSPDDQGQLAMEADKYCVDAQVKELAASYQECNPVDTSYWAKVFSLKNYEQPRYPVLTKVVKAVLTIFSGPLVESSFNIMDDIVEKDRTRLTVENYEAVAIVKTSLRRKNIRSTEMKITPQMKKSCINAYGTYQKYLKKRKEMEEQKHAQKLHDSVQQLKAEKAKRLAKLVRLKNRIVSREAKSRKRKPCGSDEPAKKFKRIKLS